MDSPSRHVHQITVGPADIDELNHVNNTVYLRYMEEAVKNHAQRVGMGVAAMRLLGVLPVVRRHTITYHRSAVLGEELEVSTLVTGFKGFRATRHNEVRRMQDGVLLVECDTDWVWIDPVRLRPKAIPLEIARAFGMAG